jgi:uncharacterized OB-fold protein
MSPVRLAAQGVVVTHTTEEVVPEGVEAPAHLAVVRLAEGASGKPPVRVLARSAKALAIGNAVALDARGDCLWAAPVPGGAR